MKPYRKLAVIWAIIIFILLLIPKKNFDNPKFHVIENLDKIIHFFIFAVCNFLLFKASYSKLTAIKRLKYTFLIILYGIILECFQEIPFIKRSFDIKDILANALGAITVWLVWEIFVSLKAKAPAQKTLVFLIFCGFSQFAKTQHAPAPPFEFRGVWIATVKNIDYPSISTLNSNQQKAEFIALVQFHKKLGINALIVQVRPHADAFYPSQFEPWSAYLTGKQGQPPFPYYDPLQFMIEETHKAGLEFHAWINPYRATINDKDFVAKNQITNIHPEWFLHYGDKKYFNPGLLEVWDYTQNIVKDICERYDIDGLHIDDYFYPYRIPNKVFPDYVTYKKNTRNLSHEAWRRSNCDTIVKRIYQQVKSINPYLKFGVSPFGVWRNKDKDPEGSNTRAGQTNYDDLYADILLWLKMGWMDYVAPQLYWEKGHKLADFDILLPWWNAHTYNKQLYIGIGIYRNLDNAKGWDKHTELPQQIKDVRNASHAQGFIFYSSKILEKESMGWKDSLKNHYFNSNALVPYIENLPQISIEAPILSYNKKNLIVNYIGKNQVKQLIIVKQISPQKSEIVFSSQFEKEAQIPLNKLEKDTNYYLFLVGRYNHLSPGLKLMIP